MKSLILFAILAISSVAYATDQPNLTLKVNTGIVTLTFSNCYSFVEVDQYTGIAIADYCLNMSTTAYQPNPELRKASPQTWQFIANWNDVQGYNASNCKLVSDTQSLGDRTLELTCHSVQQYDPNECGGVPCP